MGQVDRRAPPGRTALSNFALKQPFHNRSFREFALLEPALRDFYEAPGAPRQIPFGSDSRVQIADTQHSILAIG